MVACNKDVLVEECRTNTSTISKRQAITKNTNTLRVAYEAIDTIVKGR